MILCQFFLKARRHLLSLNRKCESWLLCFKRSQTDSSGRGNPSSCSLWFLNSSTVSSPHFTPCPDLKGLHFKMNNDWIYSSWTNDDSCWDAPVIVSQGIKSGWFLVQASPARQTQLVFILDYLSQVPLTSGKLLPRSELKFPGLTWVLMRILQSYSCRERTEAIAV